MTWMRRQWLSLCLIFWISIPFIALGSFMGPQGMLLGLGFGVFLFFWWRRNAATLILQRFTLVDLASLRGLETSFERVIEGDRRYPAGFEKTIKAVVCESPSSKAWALRSPKAGPVLMLSRGLLEANSEQEIREAIARGLALQQNPNLVLCTLAFYLYGWLDDGETPSRMTPWGFLVRTAAHPYRQLLQKIFHLTKNVSENVKNDAECSLLAYGK